MKLDDNKSIPVLEPVGSTINEQDGTSIASHTIFNTKAQKVDFSYEFTGANFTFSSATDPSINDICYSCVYDLELYVKAPSGEKIEVSYTNAAGDLVSGTSIAKSYSQADIFACGDWQKDEIDFSVLMDEQGEYVIYKSLKAQNLSLDEFVAKVKGDPTFANNLAALSNGTPNNDELDISLDVDVLTADYIDATDFTQCISDCEERSRQMALRILDITEPEAANNPVFDTKFAELKSLNCDVSEIIAAALNSSCDYLLTQMVDQFKEGTGVDANGEPADGVYYGVSVVHGNPLWNTMLDIVTQENTLSNENYALINEASFWTLVDEEAFQVDWAKELALNNHPEINHYHYCKLKSEIVTEEVGGESITHPSITSYGMEMMNIETFDEAVEKGFVDPHFPHSIETLCSEDDP